MKNEFIETPRWAEFIKAINTISDTENGRPGMMVAWGYAGRGKTECAKTFATRNEMAVRIPFYTDWTPRAMLTTICEKINGMRPGHLDRAKRIIMEEVDSQQRILMIDEANRMTVNHIEHLCDIFDETGCPIVLIGEPSIHTQIHSRTRILRRFTQAVEFGPLQNEDVMIFGLKNCGIKIPPEGAHILRLKSKESFGFLIHYMLKLEDIARSNKIENISIDIIKDLPDDLLPKPKPEGFFKS